VGETALLPDKYSGRKQLFTARNWSGLLVEIAESSGINFYKYISNKSRTKAVSGKT
jgi:hypothetical protein